MADGQALRRAEILYDTIGVASTELGVQLQAERSRSGLALTTRRLTEELGAQRMRTDGAISDLRASVTQAGQTVHVELKTALDVLTGALGRLPTIRDQIDNGYGTRLTGLTDYNRVIDTLFPVYDQLITLPDLELFQQASGLQTMAKAREMIAREQALIGAAHLDGTLNAPELAALSDYIATRKFLQSRGLAALDNELRQPYELTFGSRTFLDFTKLEATVRETGKPVPEWGGSADEAIGQLDQLGISSSRILAQRTSDMATAIATRIAVAGGAGLLAVLVSIVISVRFGRRLSGELADLRAAALDLAEVRLPQVVSRLRRGEDVDVRSEAPSFKVSGSQEIIDVAKAFASVQRTAVEAAVGQARVRQGVSQVFLNLARRKQGLLHRQLGMLDAMQRRTHDPDRLEELFRLDHLTTRMRRHAEGLITLSGAAPGRIWRRPVPVLDIVRASIAEVEDYTRVEVDALPIAAVDGTAAADLTHLLAELVENATIYSPPTTTVQVRGDSVANGYVLEVEDRGLGLLPERYAAINLMLAEPPAFDVAQSGDDNWDQLGLFVVATLAVRHGVQVVLRASPYGGTTAIVLIPGKLMAEPPAIEPDPEPVVALPEAPRKPIALVSADTHAGLPRRQRQKSLAPQLRVAPDEPEAEEPERSPEEVRDLFSAFQRGTQRGREDS
ncbi:sensor histidine kinase [Nonomuraea soli]|uniref:histidine kinase n=1 Tax=Nonomuraea soli TaxID=1032476 RepID=A0A7W0CI44_9ACTN|nr:ATP-binding protein [Nonomuraea soli]MBA2891585.1 signal transduction histidine kinase [Nonomuraea soli]